MSIKKDNAHYIFQDPKGKSNPKLLFYNQINPYIREAGSN